MEPPIDQLHPIIDDLLDAIRKRTEEIDGERQVVEEFVLPEEFVPDLEHKLLAIANEDEQREALLSLFAFSMMVEKQGWLENAQRIRQLGRVYIDLYPQLEKQIAARLLQRESSQSDDFLNTSSDIPRDLSHEDDHSGTELDEDFF